MKAVSDAPTREKEGEHEGEGELEVVDVDDVVVLVEELKVALEDFVCEGFVVLLDFVDETELLFEVETDFEDVDVLLGFVEEVDLTLDVVFTDEEVVGSVGVWTWVVTPSKQEQPLETRVVEHAVRYAGIGGSTVLSNL